MGLTNLAEHAIETDNAAPIKQHPRRVPLTHAEAEKQSIEDLRAKGVIRESTSPWASPIVLVANKDGGLRPCVDYRLFNQLVKPHGFPLPRIQDCLDAVAGSKIVSEYDQEIPQSQTADNPVEPRGRAAQPSRDTRKTN